MADNIAYLMEDPDDLGYDPEKWEPVLGQDELLTGIEEFLAKTNEPDSPDAYWRIRVQAARRVEVSRLDVED